MRARERATSADVSEKAAGAKTVKIFDGIARQAFRVRNSNWRCVDAKTVEEREKRFPGRETFFPAAFCGSCRPG
jgi:hypothetical protein